SVRGACGLEPGRSRRPLRDGRASRLPDRLRRPEATPARHTVRATRHGPREEREEDDDREEDERDRGPDAPFVAVERGVEREEGRREGRVERAALRPDVDLVEDLPRTDQAERQDGK